MHRVRRKIVGYKDSWLTPADPSAYYDEVFHLSQFKSYYFFGNWGHENYFLDVQPEILDAFTFPPLDGANAEIAERIKQTNAVSIHVRHGDYTAFGFPILTLGYYKKAVEIIREKVESPVFYVFSDDKEYIKENFEFLKDYEVVDINYGDNSYRDMQLMSLCKHNIVANSTFSTWGAKLNQNKDKIIIAPRYHVEMCHYPMGCKSWIHLDNKSL